MYIAAGVDLQKLGVVDMADFNEGRRDKEQVWRMESDTVRTSLPFNRLAIPVRLSMTINIDAEG